MSNLERIDNSPNRKFQLRIFNELDKIENAYFEYKDYIKESKAVFLEQINEIVTEINKRKVYLKTFKSSRKEAIKRAEENYKLSVASLKDDYKLELKGVNEQARLHLLKIETVYKKMVKDYKHEFKHNNSELNSKLDKLAKEYEEYLRIEKSRADYNAAQEKEQLEKQFNFRMSNILEERDEDVAEINTKYNLDEYKETKRSNSAFKKDKKDKINKLKLEMKNDLKAKSEIIETKKNDYLNQKQVSKDNISIIKLETKDYYESLSEEDKAQFRSDQRYVNQHYKARRRKKYDEKEKSVLKNVNTAYLYIAPAIFGVTFFTVLPFIFMIVASFFKLNLTKIGLSRFVGMSNFINTFTRDTEFQKALGNTVIYAFVTVILLSIVTISMAAWLSKNTRIHNIAQTMIFTPHIASLVAISILWIAMLNPNGLINQVLDIFGIEGPGWLIQENTSLISVSFVTVWKDIGYYVLIIISGLQSIPAYVYEAAKLDKAKKSTAFFKLTIPLLTPTLSFVFITKFIGSFKVFAPIEIMTNGGPMGSSMVLSYWIYKVGRIGYNYGNAMVGAIVLTILISICTIINFRYFRKQIKY